MFSTNSLAMIYIVVQVVYIYFESRVDTFNVHVRIMVYSFGERIYNSENNLIKCIVKSTAWKGSDLLSRWNSTLLCKHCACLLLFKCIIVS